EIAGHAVGVRLDDERVRRELAHRVEQPARHAEALLLGQERIGRAREEDRELVPGPPGPFALGLVLLAIGVGGVGADLEEAAPRGTARHPAVVLHVAADATERAAERAAAVGL